MKPKSANTVIIGGGVLGASAAFHLSDSGQEDVILLDRGPIASGTTPQAVGQRRDPWIDASVLGVDRFSDTYPTDTSPRARCEEVYAHHYHAIY